MIVLIDRSVASGAIVGKAISTHANHELAQKAMQDYKRCAYSVGIRPMVSIVMTKVDVGSGDQVTVGDLVDDEVEKKPVRMVYVRKPAESDDWGREPL